MRNRHAQTVWGPFTRRDAPPSRRERVVTPDGDFVDLDWHDGPVAPGAPLLLVLHGLEGSCHSHYVRGLLRLARTAGWGAVALNFRSCSGEPNRLPRFYHSGDTDDLDLVVRLLIERDPLVRIGAVGVSLGGNVLLKWLGEHGDAAPMQLAAAVGISTPYDLERCTRVLDRGIAKLTYTASFMRSFKEKVRDKARAFPEFVDVAAVMRARTFAAYDRAVTAPLHGFADERDYWRRASCRPYLARCRRGRPMRWRFSARRSSAIPGWRSRTPAPPSVCSSKSDFRRPRRRRRRRARRWRARPSASDRTWPR